MFLSTIKWCYFAHIRWCNISSYDCYKYGPTFYWERLLFEGATIAFSAGHLNKGGIYSRKCGTCSTVLLTYTRIIKLKPTVAIMPIEKLHGLRAYHLVILASRVWSHCRKVLLYTCVSKPLSSCSCKYNWTLSSLALLSEELLWVWKGVDEKWKLRILLVVQWTLCFRSRLPCWWGCSTRLDPFHTMTQRAKTSKFPSRCHVHVNTLYTPPYNGECLNSNFSGHRKILFF